MTTKDFYYWLSGYMEGVYKEESDISPIEVLENIQNKLKEVEVEEVEVPKLNIEDYSIPQLKFVPKYPSSPIADPPIVDPNTTGDPMPPAHTIICKNESNNEKTDNSDK